MNTFNGRDSILLLVDLQPRMLDGIHDQEDPSSKISAIVKVAKAAVAMGIPVVMTSVNEQQNGKFLPAVRDLFPDVNVIERKEGCFDARQNHTVLTEIYRLSMDSVSSQNTNFKNVDLHHHHHLNHHHLNHHHLNHHHLENLNGEDGSQDDAEFIDSDVIEPVNIAEETCRYNVVICGWWTSVSVCFTGLNLQNNEFSVFALVDGCGDITPLAHKYGIKRMIQNGIQPVTWMSVVSAWVGSTNSPGFQQLKELFNV